MQQETLRSTPIRITRFHYTDLVCAAMNDKTGDTQRILDRMIEDPGFTIDEEPVPGVFYIDQSVNFMYPHEIKLADFKEILVTGDPRQLSPIQDKDILNQEYSQGGRRSALIDIEDFGPDPTQDDISSAPRKKPSILLSKLLSRL